jgi:hypothetical protein
VAKLKTEIDDLIIKTLIAVQPSVAHIHHSCQPEDYLDNSMCFELLGLDVMIDQKLHPWLLEVNHAPSFGTDSKLDHIVKFKVISDSLRLARISSEGRKRFKLAHKQKTQARVLNTNRRDPAARKKPVKFADRAQLIVDAALSRSHWEDNLADLGGFRKLFPTIVTEPQYIRFHDKAIEIWETLTGGSSRKPIRISQSDLVARPPSDSSKSNDSIAAPVVSKRISAAARPPRPEFRRPERQPRLSVVPKPATLMKPPEPEPTVAVGAAGAAPATGAGGPADQTAEARRARRTKNVRPGDYVRVQTNIGWERVLVIRKDEETGKLDIQFEDGEVMGSVIPRIMKSPSVISSTQPTLQPPPPGPAFGAKIKGELSALMNVRPLPNNAR